MNLELEIKVSENDEVVEKVIDETPPEPEIEWSNIVQGDSDETIEQLYGGINVIHLRRLTQLRQFGNQAIVLSKPSYKSQISPTNRELIKPVNIVRREFQNIKEYDLNYFSWALDTKAPIHEKSRVYTLSSSEHDFWTKMVDKTTGYIRNQLKAEDAEQQKILGKFNSPGRPRPQLGVFIKIKETKSEIIKKP